MKGAHNPSSVHHFFHFLFSSLSQCKPPLLIRDLKTGRQAKLYFISCFSYQIREQALELPTHRFSHKTLSSGSVEIGNFLSNKAGQRNICTALYTPGEKNLTLLGSTEYIANSLSVSLSTHICNTGHTPDSAPSFEHQWFTTPG